MELLIYMTICHSVAIVLYELCKLFTRNRVPSNFRKWYLRISLIFLWVPFPFFFSLILPGVKRPFAVDFMSKFNIKGMNGELFWSSNYRYVYFLIGVLVVALLGYLYYISKYRSLIHYFRKGKDDKVLIETITQHEHEIRISNRVDTPAVFGFVDPVILLPDESLSKNHTELAIRHEICHIRQRDTWWNILAIVSAGFHWFNPFVYLTLEEMRKNNEVKCDEVVIDKLDAVGKRTYAEAILYYSMDEYTREGYFKTSLSHSAREVKKRVRLMYEEQAVKFSKRISMGLIAFGLIVSCLPAIAYQKSTNYVLNIDGADSDMFVERAPEGVVYFSDMSNVIPEFSVNNLGEYSFAWFDNQGKMCAFKSPSELSDSEGNHIFEEGKVIEHVLSGEQCISKLFSAQRCTDCLEVELIELVNEVNFDFCIHKD